MDARSRGTFRSEGIDKVMIAGPFITINIATFGPTREFQLRLKYYNLAS